MARDTKGFYRTGRRRNVGEHKQFHLLLDPEDYAKLAKLSHKMKLTAADVVRALVRSA